MSGVVALKPLPFRGEVGVGQSLTLIVSLHCPTPNPSPEGEGLEIIIGDVMSVNRSRRQTLSSGR